MHRVPIRVRNLENLGSLVGKFENSYPLFIEFYCRIRPALTPKCVESTRLISYSTHIVFDAFHRYLYTALNLCLFRLRRERMWASRAPSKSYPRICIVPGPNIPNPSRSSSSNELFLFRPFSTFYFYISRKNLLL